MPSLPVALQLFSVREELDADFEGTLRRVKALGYQGVEFAGLYGRSAETVRTLLSAIGLEPVSAHIPIDEFLADLDGTIDCYLSIGCQYAAIPYLVEERRPGAPGWGETVESIKTIAQAAKKKGLQLLYHNHDFEFVKLDGEYALDKLYAAIDAELLQTELDTCWVNVAGVEPVSYIRKYGKQDVPSLLEAAAESGTKWLVVEQDAPSMGKTPLECAAMSVAYLKTLL